MAASKKGKINRRTGVSAKQPATATAIKSHPAAPSKKPSYQSTRFVNALHAEHAFATRYILDGNGARSVMECGGYNPKNLKVAGVMAVELLARPSVQALLEAARAKQRSYAESQYEVTADRIIKELAYCAFSNMNDYISVQDDGTAYIDLSLLKDPERGRALAAAVQQIESETYVEGYEGTGEDRKPIMVKRTRFRLHEKRQALLELGKVTGDPRFKDVAQGQNPVFQAQQMMIVYNNIERTLTS